MLNSKIFIHADVSRVIYTQNGGASVILTYVACSHLNVVKKKKKLLRIFLSGFDSSLYPSPEFYLDNWGLANLELLEVHVEQDRTFSFTSSCLILSSSSHVRPSSTSMAFLITEAISLILSMCACISYKR